MTSPDRPTIDVDSAAWWSAIQNGRLLVNACRDCGRNSLHHRSFCPHCWSEDVSPNPACGRATLYTWTVVHQNAAPFDARTPYVVAMVDLAEGPRLMTNIENCTVEQLDAGLELILDFRHGEDGFAIPIFTPARERK
ncbi:Zn-ribbon domain-containing OB-fold protein [Mycolicibacter hiberniae]|uniref:DNA-binding protein n=1 Tax=Mycolicibacter hiberniae TaxID=29314 RepID=A0A7I7XAS1_9MYCO|nr:OB-fold domain-containing protein [Mycolicibacter hiberniae]MCV7087099.1 OB-fold domain-containing protein [Mycolicibacter hiberniae]ORV67894.1 DNA-binding protein [Mycolicibacter hiberniae]BBZ21598.1 DNA-binding protein [Mycolicibacter hiberniae]BBZ25691.1 DNA-binding protein [Mycolicibacter hiberniae]